MNLKVCRFTTIMISIIVQLKAVKRYDSPTGYFGEIGLGRGKGIERTYYAGNNNILKAVATTAHCAIEGYISAI